MKKTILFGLLLILLCSFAVASEIPTDWEYYNKLTSHMTFESNSPVVDELAGVNSSTSTGNVIAPSCGIEGSCIEFDGTTGEVNFPVANGHKLNDTVGSLICMYVSLNKTHNGNNQFVSTTRQPSQSNGYLWPYFRDSNPDDVRALSYPHASINYVKDYVLQTWYHMCYYRDRVNSLGLLYDNNTNVMNGSEVGSDTLSPTGLRLGNRESDLYFGGRIDEFVVLHNVTNQTQAEDIINQLYTRSYTTITGPSSGPAITLLFPPNDYRTNMNFFG